MHGCIFHCSLLFKIDRRAASRGFFLTQTLIEMLLQRSRFVIAHCFSQLVNNDLNLRLCPLGLWT